MLLRWTAHPCLYSDLIPRFSRPVLKLSMITNCVIDNLDDNHGHRLTYWNHQIMSPPPLQRHADSVSAQGAPLKNCFGFIDGTVRPICRPVDLQEVVYNGHKRVHALKFQSLPLPFGLIGINVCCFCNHSQCSNMHVWQSNISFLCSWASVGLSIFLGSCLFCAPININWPTYQLIGYRHSANTSLLLAYWWL